MIKLTHVVLVAVVLGACQSEEEEPPKPQIDDPYVLVYNASGWLLASLGMPDHCGYQVDSSVQLWFSDDHLHMLIGGETTEVCQQGNAGGVDTDVPIRPTSDLSFQALTHTGRFEPGDFKEFPCAWVRMYSLTVTQTGSGDAGWPYRATYLCD